MDLIINAFLLIFGLCWGSFLNVLAYRILREKDWIFTRSSCQSCKRVIKYYDLIPFISWLILRGKCRFCKKKISYLYPLIEMLSGLLFVSLYNFVPAKFFLVYFLFFSLLIINIRTDLEDFLILSGFTYLGTAIGVIFGFFSFLEISFLESISGTILGYFILWSSREIYFRIKKIEGLGLGDLDLIAMIGAFNGIYGVIFSIMLGSIIAVISAIIYFIFFKKEKNNFREIKIPFGPFLSIAAILDILCPGLKLIIF